MDGQCRSLVPSSNSIRSLGKLVTYRCSTTALGRRQPDEAHRRRQVVHRKECRQAKRPVVEKKTGRRQDMLPVVSTESRGEDNDDVFLPTAATLCGRHIA